MKTDILIVGAGPVGLLNAYLAQMCGLSTVILDKSSTPLEVGRADALNARTLQLLEIAGLFDELLPQGLPCNTSSIWQEGKFTSRQSKWWDELAGCYHKHFLMLGQSYVEQLIDKKLTEINAGVLRETTIESLELKDTCVAKLSNGDMIEAKYVIGADGARSFVRNHFKIPFEITRPQIVWAVIDAVFETDFPKVPEIIVFQAQTSDVAYIPREGNIDRFYVRMDKEKFEIEEAMEKINRAMSPRTIAIKDLVWFSQFSVKESVAESFSIDDRVFLAGDSSHIHSVNGGQGLNTGLADAFNLIWKINMVENHGAGIELLKTYEFERKPVAKSVIETSGELVRTTKFSEKGTHAQDYIQLVQKKAGNITGMGIRYGKTGLVGARFNDFKIEGKRIYSMLDYTKYNLIVFNDEQLPKDLPKYINPIKLDYDKVEGDKEDYHGKAVLVRPDGYIAKLDDLIEKVI